MSPSTVITESDRINPKRNGFGITYLNTKIPKTIGTVSVLSL